MPWLVVVSVLENLYAVFQVDEESESKSDLTRQVAKAHAECSLWRNKYEQEGVAR